MARVLRRNRAWLAGHGDEPMTASQVKAFDALARRRREGEPVAYLIGRREFYGLDLEVTPDVLIPRPETELLVELALIRIDAGKDTEVLDLGSGCGAVALAIASERPRCTVLGVDVSDAALALARRNASRLKLSNATFIESDWFTEVPNRRYHAIVANPPYVASGDPHLIEGDLRFEPPLALAAGVDGLASIRAIIDGAGAYLSPGASLLIEHGHDQADAVQSMLRAAGFSDVQSRRDLAGISRAALGRM
ncbi:MAG: peptide chain release factor N(5)-glutamine methyltransferase [Pseudomonadota bacterium]|nr:peptide chain release factor N(5)-glutamine methyltransferase [Pseudomonadota bacterium]